MARDKLHAPDSHGPPPAVDDHFAPPETRVEYIHGVKYLTSPARRDHAMRHFDLAYVLGAHVKRGYSGAVDMLTRTGKDSDFAPDASVFATEPDPATGGRKLEELAFEVSDKQNIGVPTKKAQELIRRGVRRVFCVVVKKRQVFEWSRATDGWQMLDRAASIEDACFARAPPVGALLDAAETDGAVARALLAKGEPVLAEAMERGEARGLEKGREEGREEGIAEGIRRAILDALDVRGLVVGPAVVARIAAERNVGVLDTWRTRAKTAASAEEATQ